MFSLIYLSVQIIRATRLTSTSNNEYKPLLQVGNGHYGAVNGHVDPSEEASDTEEEYITIHHTITSESRIVEDRPKGELLIVVIEEAAVLGQLALHVVAYIFRVYKGKGSTAAIAQVATWAYITTLTSLRLLSSSHPKLSFSRIWYHTISLYCLLWILSSLLLRSEIIHPRTNLARTVAIIDFCLTTLLALIALNSRKGNRTVKLEYEGKLVPSNEQTASVFSLATFTWLDELILKGYQKPLEIEDVWDLLPQDKAVNVIADYRQVKKTSILAWHLMKHFKRSLLIQASWAVLSGLLTFAPTLLLKAILEYVENPVERPKNTAWFYVILLFVSGCVSAVADGQALYIGRRICIRLRAIIIGEIYAKALKRKVSATTDKILMQEKDDGKKPSLIRKLLCLGAASTDNDNESESAPEGEDDAQVSSGAIINLMAVDSFKVSEICAYLHFLWASTPVQFLGTIFLLYRILGASSFVGIAMMAILLPVNLLISKKFASLQKKILAATDARVNITNEVLSNIRIIKFFAWEERFMAQVDEKRCAEIKAIRNRYVVWSFAATVWSGAPVLITLLSFMVYTRVEHKDLIPSVAFTASSLFMILRIPLDQLADMVAHVQESKVSVDRVEEYLNEPETDKFNQLKHNHYDENGDPYIGFDNTTVSWGAPAQMETEAFKLMDLNIKFRPYQFNVIIGRTGSGKTSMLMALLGEMTLLKGNVHLPGTRSREDSKPDPETGLIDSVAYCAQQAWLVNNTIRENIVFASIWDPQRYQSVIRACSLERDLEILDAGDQTLVGEKGVTLSGGQKQRISLARALYSRARHILLDDIMSAVDTHTANWIFQEALLGPLMANRTCILVTHSVTMALPHADYAIVLDNGRVTTQGTPQEIVKSGKLTDEMAQSVPPSKAPSRVASDLSSDSDELIATGANTTINGPVKSNDDNQLSRLKSSTLLNQTEGKAVGRVQFRVMLLYLAAMGSWFYWSTAAFIFLAGQVVSVSTNVWLREWANAYARKVQKVDLYVNLHPSIHLPSSSGLYNYITGGISSWSAFFKGMGEYRTLGKTEQVDDWYYLSIYAAIGGVLMLTVFFREAVLFWGSINASRRIHRQLMEHVMRAKFRFFDSTPLGQIINRFSKDIEAIDQEVTPSAIGLIYCILSVVTTIILISVITPGFLITAFFITVLYFLIGMFYINSSRDLKRLESVNRSPLYQQFGETLSGMTTIRAYGDERRFIRENLAKINTQSRPFIYLWGINRWLAMRVDVIGALVSFFSGVFVLQSVGKIDPGAAGLALTYAITYTENILWLVRLYASNEQNMNSVERIKEYIDVDQEAAPIIETNRPPANWPSKGSVEFIAYSTRYRVDFDMVLKKITFKVRPGEKVGVVGRTGAGKSSMALAIFRALEAEEGKILVDNVDIGLIGLQDLRENIVMVPQDPTLFTGTIRSNLDPFGLFTDEEIFATLRSVELIGSPGPSATSTPPNRPSTAIDEYSTQGSPQSSDNNGALSGATLYAPPIPENKNIFLNLSSPIAESGTNLSQGQRQLLCLARALLTKPAVLLMDEATASIDHATDAKIQETIRQLKNTTITIAHRLKTIVDYDKVLVLERGEVVEFGSPDALLETKGVFWGMCDQSGEMDTLKDIAFKAAKARKEKGQGEDGSA